MEKLASYCNKKVLKVILRISLFNYTLNQFKYHITITADVKVIN